MDIDMDIKLKISFIDSSGVSFMGRGPYLLLKGIQKFNSIRQAASEMKMSYVKSLKILNTLEEHFGKAILIREKGGNSRKGTSLTEFGETLLDNYAILERNIIKNSEKEFDKFLVRLPGGYKKK